MSAAARRRLAPRPAAALALVALVAAAGPAAAVDGVVEINAARAAAGGVTPGDAAGYPVTLSVGGSYRLTSDLRVSSADTTAIEITTGDVTLDLNGFGLLGVVTCSGSPVTGCAPAGSGRGVAAPNQIRVVVRNGRVRGFGSNGVSVGREARLSDLVVTHNGANGVSTSEWSEVTHVTASLNDGSGVSVGDGRVEGVVARGNALNGIAMLWGVVQGSVTEGNGSNGIVVTGAGTVVDSTARGNTFDGIRIVQGTVSRCTLTDNAGDGVQIDHGNVQDSTLRSNAGAGIRAGAAGRIGYAGNVLTGNNGGAETQVLLDAAASATVLGTNLCGSDTTCP